MARFYAACLASYNNGVLHGRWIEATSNIDEMQAEVSAMLRESKFPNVTVKCPVCEGTGKTTFHNSETGATRQGPCYECLGFGHVDSAEEWAMHDSEGLPSSIGEYSGLQPIADFIELVEEHDSFEEDDLMAILSDYRTIEECRDALDDSFVGIYDSFKDYAEEAADEMLAAHDIRDSHPLMQYFDYDSYARDLRHSMNAVELPSNKVAIFHA
ncbi:antirestriction protein ArdA [Brucella sp. 10RB9213]|uniref:antirestriction protein ArdA n=1 Tax=Brucella sp. 10RB9213 TaxID=1844039 RepID=UPI0012AD26A1|nr:antirestriction protein ArdA [Brucella sp. 10RB9213]MRN66418.1 antirestriction protein ArdA [Brucella sp. 10RB9213]